MVSFEGQKSLFVTVVRIEIFLYIDLGFFELGFLGILFGFLRVLSELGRRKWIF